MPERSLQAELNEMPTYPRWLYAGDTALIWEFGNRIAPEINAQVLATARAIEAAQIEGIQEVVPAFRSLSIYFDPLKVRHTVVREAVEPLVKLGDASQKPEQTWHIPVCYDDKFALDLNEVSEALGMSRQQVITKHSQSDFRVYVLGFMPGFSFLGGMDPSLNLPRRSTPRTLVPKGSVAIAMGLGGVYPFDSPGGWHVLGHTPTNMYEGPRSPSILFAPGDGVRFVPIDRGVHNRLEAEGGTSLAMLKGEKPFA